MKTPVYYYRFRKKKKKVEEKTDLCAITREKERGCCSLRCIAALGLETIVKNRKSVWSKPQASRIDLSVTQLQIL